MVGGGNGQTVCHDPGKHRGAKGPADEADPFAPLMNDLSANRKRFIPSSCVSRLFLHVSMRFVKKGNIGISGIYFS